jgi:hypothetical protein
VKNQWAVAATAGGLRANSEAIAIEVAMFQYAVGASMDGKLGPGTLTSLRSFQQKDYYAEASRNPRLAYGISLAQHIVIGTSEAKWALAAKYNKEEAARGQFSLVGSYYKGADDPKLASEVALVQAAHGVAADGRMNAETISLFKRLVREGGKEGFLLSGSPLPGVSPSSPTPGATGEEGSGQEAPGEEGPRRRRPEGRSLVGACASGRSSPKQPVAESNTGMVVGLRGRGRVLSHPELDRLLLHVSTPSRAACHKKPCCGARSNSDAAVTVSKSPPPTSRAPTPSAVEGRPARANPRRNRAEAPAQAARKNLSADESRAAPRPQTALPRARSRGHSDAGHPAAHGPADLPACARRPDPANAARAFPSPPPLQDAGVFTPGRS